jgi:hypothetical protein
MAGLFYMRLGGEAISEWSCWHGKADVAHRSVYLTVGYLMPNCSR